MPGTFRIGLEMKLYYQTTGTRAAWPGSGSAPNLTEITIARNVTINGETGESDVSIRGGGSFRQYVPTLKDFSIDCQLLYQVSGAGNAIFDAIRNHYINQTVFGLAALDGASDGVGVQGFWLDAVVTNFTQNEPLDEGVMVDVRFRNSVSDVPLALVTVAT